MSVTMEDPHRQDSLRQRVKTTLFFHSLQTEKIRNIPLVNMLIFKKSPF